MSNATRISWTDATWNPVVGCSHASPGCDHCYAERMAQRLANMGVEKYRDVVKDWRWTGRTSPDPKALAEPIGWRKPRSVFVCSMGDLFHESVLFEWADRVWAVMALCPQHRFQILTKRADRMLEYTRQVQFQAGQRYVRDEIADRSSAGVAAAVQFPLPNVALGVTVENQEQAEKRIPLLLQCPARWRFVSYEPALGPVDFSPWLPRMESLGPCLDGILAGGESGPGARPAHPDWFRKVRDDCAASGVAFHFKQWGEWWPQEQGQFLDHPPTDGMSDAEFVRVGKKAAGRLLDGRTHDDLPWEDGR